MAEWFTYEVSSHPIVYLLKHSLFEVRRLEYNGSGVFLQPPKKEPAKGAKKAAVKPKGAKRESVYSRKCVLSPELAAVMGEDQMARHDVVKRMWGIFRERELFDPSNKQFGICDSQLLKVFGKKRVQLFGMMKYLKSHIKDIE